MNRGEVKGARPAISSESRRGRSNKEKPPIQKSWENFARRVLEITPENIEAEYARDIFFCGALAAFKNFNMPNYAEMKRELEEFMKAQNQDG